MKSLFRVSSVFILLSVFACQNPNEELYGEVMSIHDEVMPKMDDLYKAKQALQKQLDTEELDSIQQENVREKIARINSASEQMMVWMRQFNPEGEREDSVRVYLESELVKIQKVRDDILQALEANALSE